MRSALFQAAILVMATSASGQDSDITYSLNGVPGLLDMPTAQSAETGALALTYSGREGLNRTTFTFQFTPKLSGSFRFTGLDLNDGMNGLTDDLDRNFDLRYRLNDETGYLPAFAIGMQNIMTPGRMGGEYIVATKSIGDNVTVTAGLGWGVLGTRDSIAAPFADTRPAFDETMPTGQLASDQWFRGDAALFGGVEYRLNDTWGFKAEYASIETTDAAFSPAFETDQPYNLGVTYRPFSGVQLGAAYLYGNTFAVSGTLFLNANNRPNGSGLDPAPAPVNARAANDRSWDQTAAPASALRVALTTLLAREGIALTDLQITGDTARLRYINRRFRSQAQAMGRAARMMTQVMPPAIETFVLEPQTRGIPLSAVTLGRSDLEQLENRAGAAQEILDRSTLADADLSSGLSSLTADQRRWQWGLGPSFEIIPPKGSGTVGLDVGISLRGTYAIRPNLVLAGSISQSLTRNDGADPVADSTPEVQNVRTDSGFYGDDGVPVLQTLSLSHYGRPATNLYSRVSAGYLERMFGGVSGELLWKPVNSRLGLGAELNYLAQRDSDMLFGFDEYDYDIVNGHVSAYYDLGSGYQTQLDVGRYLAGDWGATLSLAREFDNGVRVGAFVTQTDLTYDDFGDGSYNKGIRIEIPRDFLTGRPSRAAITPSLRTRTGDGGAQLSVDGRLYDLVRDAHRSDLEDTWGRFWR